MYDPDAERWFTLIAITGVTLYFLAYWQLYFGSACRTDIRNRLMRFLGLVMILTPLLVRWYLDASLLLFLGVGIVATSCYYLVRRKLRH